MKTISFNLKLLHRVVMFALAEQQGTLNTRRPIAVGPDGMPFVAHYQPFRILVK